MGGLAAEAAGGDFKTGAVAAGLNEALVNTLAQHYAEIQPEKKQQSLLMNSQLLGVLAAASANGDGDSSQMGAWVASYSTQYNYLTHEEVENKRAKEKACADDGCVQDVREEYAELDEGRNKKLADLCRNNPGQCEDISAKLSADEPKLRALAKEAAGQGEYGASVVIGYVISSSNQDAQNIITSELSALEGGDGSRFLSVLGSTLLSATMGGRSVVTKQPVYRMTKEAKVAAEALGYQKISETVHGGQALFRKGKSYITRDLDGHNGGAWKTASSVKALESRTTRDGTFDKNLNRIGD